VSYEIWNSLIASHWFSLKNAGRSIVLSADDHLFAELAQKGAEDLALDGQNPVEHFVDSVRATGRWWCRPLPKDHLPSTACYIAMAVLAAAHMDREDSGRSQQGSLRYWQPFRELYGLSRGGQPLTQIPKELGPVWLRLWLEIEKWANKDNQGKFGFVRLPRQRPDGFDAHKHIRYPKSQSLLRLDDLRRLTWWFKDLGLLPRDQVGLSWFKTQVADNLNDSEFFSTHARRVLKDELRDEAALIQIMSYFSQWEGETWEPSAASFKRMSYSRWVFTHRDHDESFGVGLQTREKGRWIVTHRLSEFPITQSERNLAPIARLPRSPFVALWDDHLRGYIQSKTVASRERFLLFVATPECNLSHQEQLRYLQDCENMLHAVADDVQGFHAATLSPPSINWIRVGNLKGRWAVFSGTTKSPLDRETIPIRFENLFAFDVSKVRTTGGAKLSRRYWMAGAGPSLQVDGPIPSGTIHCKSWAKTTTHTTIKFRDRVAMPSLNERWPLDHAGVHRLWVEGSEQSELTVRVKPAEMAVVGGYKPGWVVAVAGWQTKANVSSESAYVSGAELAGLVPAAMPSVVRPAREWIEAAIRIYHQLPDPTHGRPQGLLARQIRSASQASPTSKKQTS